MARLRQIAEVTRERIESDRRYQGVVVEWQTKVLAEVIAATVPLDPKQAAKGNPLQPLLDSIHLFSTPREGTSSPRRPGQPPQEAWTPDQPGEAEKRVQPGSYERFLGSFGQAIERR